MPDVLSGPHLWVLLVTLLYLVLVLASVVRAIRLPRLSLLARVVWCGAIVAVPLGGLVVFWASHWPTQPKENASM